MFGAVSATTARWLARFTVSQLNLLPTPRSLHNSVITNVRSKDLAHVAVTPKVTLSQDILLQNMRSAKNSSEVLNAIDRHHSIMNTNHAVQALRTLFNLQKGHSSNMSNGEVVNSRDFRKLCDLLKSQIRHIDLSDLIDVLKCLGYLGVSANSKIMSLVLNLISKQVNDLSLQQITFLDFIIKDMKPIPLVKALKIALPIVFEANLQSKCDFDNVTQLSELFYFVAKRKHMENSSDDLVKALMEKREELTVKEAKNIVYAMCDSRVYNENYQLLLYHALDVVTDKLDTMDFYDMESILGRLCSKHIDSSGDLSYYHEEFCNNCVRLVIQKEYSFEHSLWILKKLVKFSHVHLGLLDHLASKVEKEPWQLEHSGAAGLISFLQGFSQGDYKPHNWDRLKPLIIKACQNVQDRPELPWLRVLLDLCILDCWNRELLEMVFSRKFLTSFMSREYNKLDRIQLLMLDQVSATLAPWDVKPRAPQDILPPIVQINGSHVTTFPLKAALAQGLGGQEYVQTGVLTPLGHFLDHVVVMRKGGYPVTINSSTESGERITTEEIHIPNDSRMVAVLFVPSSMCAVNNERVRGLIRIQVNSMEALGIAVAPVLQSVWSTLPDFERIPYLMRAVREKLPDQELTNIVTPV